MSYFMYTDLINSLLDPRSTLIHVDATIHAQVRAEEPGIVQAALAALYCRMVIGINTFMRGRLCATIYDDAESITLLQT